MGLAEAEIHALEMYTREVHVHEMHADEMGARDTTPTTKMDKSSGQIS
jgi:hypothetical protein